MEWKQVVLRAWNSLLHLTYKFGPWKSSKISQFCSASLWEALLNRDRHLIWNSKATIFLNNSNTFSSPKEVCGKEESQREMRAGVYHMDTSFYMASIKISVRKYMWTVSMDQHFLCQSIWKESKIYFQSQCHS